MSRGAIWLWPATSHLKLFLISNKLWRISQITQKRLLESPTFLWISMKRRYPPKNLDHCSHLSHLPQAHPPAQEYLHRHNLRSTRRTRPVQRTLTKPAERTRSHLNKISRLLNGIASPREIEHICSFQISLAWEMGGIIRRHGIPLQERMNSASRSIRRSRHCGGWWN